MFFWMNDDLPNGISHFCLRFGRDILRDVVGIALPVVVFKSLYCTLEVDACSGPVHLSNNYFKTQILGVLSLWLNRVLHRQP